MVTDHAAGGSQVGAKVVALVPAIRPFSVDIPHRVVVPGVVGYVDKRVGPLGSLRFEGDLNIDCVAGMVKV